MQLLNEWSEQVLPRLYGSVFVVAATFKKRLCMQVQMITWIYTPEQKCQHSPEKNTVDMRSAT